jgi:hypothetical protein
MTTSRAGGKPRSTFGSRQIGIGTEGRLVANPVDRVMSAGPHEVTWSGLDKDGRRLASGVYYYRLQAPGFTRSRRMVLLK